nr:hypothetical protein [Candidatus Sigynarchaeota archaeon]
MVANAPKPASKGPAKVPEPEPEVEPVLEPECDGDCLACNDVPCEDIVNDWGQLQGILDMEEDIDEKVIFLQRVISRNKFLCYDGRCPIFTDILKLRQKLADFDLPLTRLSEIKRCQMTEKQRKLLFDKYKRAKYECDLTLSEIMRVAQVNKALDYRDETAHKRRLELIRELNKNNFPLPFNVKADIEEQLNTTSNSEQWKNAQDQTKKEVKFCADDSRRGSA